MLLISQLIEQVFNVEFETNQFWLKSYNSNKVVVEAIQEGKLVGVVQTLIVNCSTKLKNNNLIASKI